MPRLIFREEDGGALLYDRETWRLAWLKPNDAERFLRDAGPDTAVHQRPATGCLSAPLKAFMGITARCNLACGHCVVERTRNAMPDLPLAEAEGILTQLGRLGVLEVRFSGGEPCMRPDIDDLVACAKDNNLSVSMNSNGVFSQETARRLAKSGVDRVHISLDGMEANNDRIRGAGVYRRAISTVRYLREMGVYVRIVVCLDRKNVDDLDSVIRLAEDLDVDVKFSPIAAVGAASSMGDLLGMNDCLDVDRRISGRCATVNVFYNHGTMPTFAASECKLTDFDSTVCGSARTQLRLELTGHVYGAGCGDAEAGKLPLGTRDEAISVLWDRAQRQVMADLAKRGGPCLECTLSTVFGSWLAGPSPSFNFRRSSAGRKP